MQIKVCRIEDGPARVEVVNGETGEVYSSTDVNVGQEVTLGIANTPDQPVEVGEVSETSAAAEEGSGDGSGSGGEETATGGEPGGDGGGSGQETASA